MGPKDAIILEGVERPIIQANVERGDPPGTIFSQKKKGKNRQSGRKKSRQIEEQQTETIE